MNPMKSEHVVRSHLSAAQVVAEWLAYRPAFPLVGLDRVFQGKDWRWGSKYPPGAPVPPKRCGATVIPLDILPQESESGALHGRGRTRPRNAGAEPNPMCLRVRILRVGWMIPETPPRIVSRRDRSFGVDRAHHPSPLLRCIRVRARARARHASVWRTRWSTEARRAVVGTKRGTRGLSGSGSVSQRMYAYGKIDLDRTRRAPSVKDV